MAVISTPAYGAGEALHSYRNEAYHGAEVRPETIRTATLILLEIICQMLLTVSRGAQSMSSDENYSWLKERFDVKPFLTETQLQSIVDEIVLDFSPTIRLLQALSRRSFAGRFSGLHDSLDFIVESGSEAG